MDQTSQTIANGIILAIVEILAGVFLIIVLLAVLKWILETVGEVIGGILYVLFAPLSSPTAYGIGKHLALRWKHRKHGELVEDCKLCEKERQAASDLKWARELELHQTAHQTARDVDCLYCRLDAATAYARDRMDRAAYDEAINYMMSERKFP